MTPRICCDLVTTAATCLDQERSSLMMIPRYLNSDTLSTGFPFNNSTIHALQKQKGILYPASSCSFNTKQCKYVTPKRGDMYNELLIVKTEAL